MADYGGVGGGGSLRDALNQLYPLTNLGGISTGYPPGVGAPSPRVGITALPVAGQAGTVIPPVPPVPGPSGLAPPNPQDDSAQAQLMQRLGMNQPGMMGSGSGPPNYAAQLGFQQWRNNPGLDKMVVPPFGLPPDRNTINPDAMMPVLQQYRRAGQENI